MSREKKERVPVNARLDKDVIDRLDAYCENTGVTKTHVMEKSIISYIDKQEEDARISKGLAVMDENTMQEFIARIGRTELYDELEDLQSDKYPLVRQHGRPSSRYLKAVRVTLATLGYDQQWVDTTFRSALEKKYLS